MSNSFGSLTPQQLRKAATLKEKIEALEKELSALLGGGSQPSVKAKAGGKKKGSSKRVLSPEGRARIIAAQKRRWKNTAAKKAA